MSVVHADRVDLLFVTLDAVGSTNVVSEDPGLSGGLGTGQTVSCTASEER